MAPRRRILITGATRGIGRDAALHLARRGHKVMATGRAPDLLQSLERQAKESSLPMVVAPMDVRNQSATEETVARALREMGGLDALVNNAGYGLSGAFEELSLAETRDVFETNFFSPLRLSQAVLPSMRGQGHGTIVNVGSVAGIIGLPMEGAYSATKFALRSMSRSMRMELAPFGIRVVLIEPGLVHTDFHANKMVGQRAAQGNSAYTRMHLDTALRNRARALFGGQTGRTAMRIRQVIESPRPAARYTVGLDAWAGEWAARLLPDWFLDLILRRVIIGR